MSDPAGTRVLTPEGNLVGINLAEIPNADASAPMMLEIEQQCDLEHWHRVGRTPLPCYDNESWQDREVSH